MHGTDIFSVGTIMLLSSMLPSNWVNLAAILDCAKLGAPVEFHMELCCVYGSVPSSLYTLPAQFPLIDEQC